MPNASLEVVKRVLYTGPNIGLVRSNSMRNDHGDQTIDQIVKLNISDEAKFYIDQSLQLMQNIAYVGKKMYSGV